MIPAQAVEAASEALVYHQRRDIKGCTCGWSKPGRSYPEHQARIALEAAAPHMQGAAWESGYTLGYADCANKQESNRPNPYKEEV